MTITRRLTAGRDVDVIDVAWEAFDDDSIFL